MPDAYACRDFGMIKNADSNWVDDKAMMHNAALSYYSVFSLAPLLLITLAVSEFFFGEEASH